MVCGENASSVVQQQNKIAALLTLVCSMKYVSPRVYAAPLIILIALCVHL